MMDQIFFHHLSVETHETNTYPYAVIYANGLFANNFSVSQPFIYHSRHRNWYLYRQDKSWGAYYLSVPVTHSCPNTGNLPQPVRQVCTFICMLKNQGSCKQKVIHPDLTPDEENPNSWRWSPRHQTFNQSSPQKILIVIVWEPLHEHRKCRDSYKEHNWFRW